MVIILSLRKGLPQEILRRLRPVERRRVRLRAGTTGVMKAGEKRVVEGCKVRGIMIRLCLQKSIWT